MRIGIDIGSTTMKVVVTDERGTLLHRAYRRHKSEIPETARDMLRAVRAAFPLEARASVALSGSAGMGVAEALQLPFVQEVYATQLCVEARHPDTDVVIELGGEDAKILFLSGMTDARMNGTCAGGTGAFIDQMAALLQIDPDTLDTLAAQHETIYTIASRCGVFAKTDIQPLINQGAKTKDIAASIFQAVVNQTVGGLAQGRPIAGRVLYLGGPLTFMPQLRAAFDRTLCLTGICPEDSLYYVALGAAQTAHTAYTFDMLLERFRDTHAGRTWVSMPPLFADEKEYAAFLERHNARRTPTGELAAYAEQGVYIGIDAGSTTIKCAVIGADGTLLRQSYQNNTGNPIPAVRAFLTALYADFPAIRIRRCAVTGYGEGLIRAAFQLDDGVVETVAHYTAARQLVPDVDFVLDIGGQDMKCLKIRNGAIDNIYLNEACSSGCGSFLQAFAEALGDDVETFARRGLYAARPVDLGSRCTVFMNSSVKQAQKDGAEAADISAGLSISVIKNALYKVIRPNSPDDLGRRIVVQGGTFHNDAVLRAFEQEMKLHVTRPDIAGLMGAYGAALYARAQDTDTSGASSVLTEAALASFVHKTGTARCGRCPNNCRLTVNTFADGRRHLSGNRCETPNGGEKKRGAGDNMYRRKLEMLLRYAPQTGTEPIPRGKRPVVGLPLGLNLYELLPFWTALFDRLGFDTVTSPVSDRSIFLKGQNTVPSDTVCYPAKLMHGHVRALIEAGAETIFYPCMTYNVADQQGDNCYNCPVVAYYPEVIRQNMPDTAQVRLIHDYVGLHRPGDLPEKLHGILLQYFPEIGKRAVKEAVQAAYAAQAQYQAEVTALGQSLIAEARAAGKPILVLAGRPYHIDPEIHHGIDELIGGMGLTLVSEDAFAGQFDGAERMHVLNQWTYHRRLYAAAQAVAAAPDMQFVQLVSFGCGCDAVTTDECRRILERAGKLYTQIKIDEIENLGAVRIRLRSLMAAAGETKHGA